MKKNFLDVHPCRMYSSHSSVLHLSIATVSSTVSWPSLFSLLPSPSLSLTTPFPTYRTPSFTNTSKPPTPPTQSASSLSFLSCSFTLPTLSLMEFNSRPHIGAKMYLSERADKNFRILRCRSVSEIASMKLKSRSLIVIKNLLVMSENHWKFTSIKSILKLR